MNLKYVQDLYTENKKTLFKELKVDISGRIFWVHGFEGLISLDVSSSQLDL